MVDCVPDLSVMAHAQCFPLRYLAAEIKNGQDTMI